MHFVKKIISFYIGFLIIGSLFVPVIADARSKLELVFTPPCVKIGIAGIDSCGDIEVTDLKSYIVRVYQFAVGISGIVAVGMIVYGAILIIIKSENVVAKSEGRQIIQDALWGVILLFSSYLLLKTINPDIVKLQEPYAGESSVFKTMESAESIKNLAASSTCAGATQILGVTGGGGLYNTTPEVQNNCTYRHLYDKDGASISSDGYYDEDESIPAQSVLWVYPYFLPSQGVSSAKCLIYAYRSQFQKAANEETGGAFKKTTMIDLNPSLRPCLLPEGGKQEMGWDQAIGGLIGGQASTTEIMQILKNADFSLYDGSPGDCEPRNKTNPNGILQDIKTGQYPYVCNSNCECNNTKSVTLSYGLANLLMKMQADKSQLPAFRFNSLTGGRHRNGSDHYLGTAVDIGAISKGRIDTEKILTYLIQFKGKGISDLACEYFEQKTTDQTKSLVRGYTDCRNFDWNKSTYCGDSNPNCVRQCKNKDGAAIGCQSALHIHARWQ